MNCLHFNYFFSHSQIRDNYAIFLCFLHTNNNNEGSCVWVSGEEKSWKLLTWVYILGITVSCFIFFFEIHSFSFTEKLYLFNHPGLCLQIFVAWEHKESWFKRFGKLCKEAIIPPASFVRCLNLIPLHEKSLGETTHASDPVPFQPCLGVIIEKAILTTQKSIIVLESIFFLKFLINPL